MISVFGTYVPNHVREQGLEHVQVPVLFLFPVNPEHGQHCLGVLKEQV